MNKAEIEQTAGQIESATVAVLALGIVTCVLAFAHLVLVICLLWNVIRTEKGADRIAWLLIIPVPVFGPLAFFFILRRERARKRAECENASYQKALEWVKTRPKSLYD